MGIMRGKYDLYSVFYDSYYSERDVKNIFSFILEHSKNIKNIEKIYAFSMFNFKSKLYKAQLEEKTKQAIYRITGKMVSDAYLDDIVEDHKDLCLTREEYRYFSGQLGGAISYFKYIDGQPILIRC